VRGVLRGVARALLCAALVACARPAQRPDVLLVTIDTLRADALGAFGAGADASPQLDALARQSALFPRALAASASTAPSHASIFTSRFVRGHSVGQRNGSSRLGDVPTLATAFADAGYETAGFVSNIMLRRQQGFDRGFAIYDDALPDSEANRHVFERVAAQTAAAAQAWLAQPHARPVFVWVHFNDPHGPYSPPREWVRPLPSPAGEAPLPVLPYLIGLRGIPAYQAVGDERLPSQYRARYAGEVRYLDAELGKLLAAFEARPRGRDAVIALTADHGEAMGEDEIWFCHGYAVTPNLAHVALLVRAPGLPAGSVTGTAHHVDVAPTLLELAGLPPLPGSAGIALGPIARAGGEIPLRTLFVETLGEIGAYRGDRFVRQATDPLLGDPLAWAPRESLWRDGDGVEAAAPDPELEDSLRRYAAVRAPLQIIPEALNDADRDRLRALGYLAPAPSPAARDPK
jgi:arylsulfatase